MRECIREKRELPIWWKESSTTWLVLASRQESCEITSFLKLCPWSTLMVWSSGTLGALWLDRISTDSGKSRPRRCIQWSTISSSWSERLRRKEKFFFSAICMVIPERRISSCTATLQRMIAGTERESFPTCLLNRQKFLVSLTVHSAPKSQRRELEEWSAGKSLASWTLSRLKLPFAALTLESMQTCTSTPVSCRR